MSKTTKMIMATIIVLGIAIGGGYAFNSYQKSAELKDTSSITNKKGGKDVTWDTIKTAAKSNDVLVVFVDSTTPYFNPVMKAVESEVKQSTKNNPKVLIVDRHQQSYSKLATEINSTEGLGDYVSDPYAIAYKKNEHLSKNSNEMVNVHHNFKVEDNNTNVTTTPTNIADTDSDDYDVKFPRNDKEVHVQSKMLKAFFEGTWVTYKDDDTQ
ncbi:hypothetical protein [Weissella minor]|uniref:hypothetical protein n=1 Tax=Weissella minor TaxID=1620 RepID=UPI003AF2F84C